MKGFNSVDSYKQLYYILGHPQFSQRQMARDLEMSHGAKISSFINWLEDLHFVKKIYQTKNSKNNYEVSSRVDLVNFYSRHRNMQKLKLETYMIGVNKTESIEFLNKNGGIMCMSTALQIYDDEYYRDPEIHVYDADRNLLNVLDEQVQGKVKVSIYNLDYPDTIKERNKINVTSKIRTIIDLFCNNEAYAAEQFIQSVWN